MTTDTTLIEALKLARLDPKERFTKENITKIHNGIKPYWTALTGCELKKDDVIVGYGYIGGIGGQVMYRRQGCENYVYDGVGLSVLYCVLKSVAICQGWIDANDTEFREPIKWITNRAPTSKEVSDYNLVVVPFNGFYRSEFIDNVKSYIQPWQTVENAKKMTTEELSDIPDEFRWEKKEGK